MRKQLHSNRGLKRRKAPGNFDRKNRSKKNRIREEPVVRSRSPSPSPCSSADLSDERELDVAVEEVVQKDSSMYDSLLMTLQSCNGSLAPVYKNRQRQQEGKSDSEQEEVEDHESPSLSDEEDIVAEGCVERSSKSHAVESRWQETSTIGTVDEDADTESEDSEASETDQEQNGDANTYSVGASTSSSSFHLHLGHNLSEAEAENLKTKKWKYKWKVPAFNLSNCSWVGTGECFIRDVGTNSAYNVKEKLYNHWLDVCKKSGFHDFHSSKQGFFFSLCNSYRDILHCNKRPFYQKGWEEDSSIMDAYIMHSLNHIFRTRDLVKKNEAKLAKQQESTKAELLASGALLDHGFTRPKVLILLPFRSIALRVVKRLLHLTPPAYRSKVEYADRFFKEYGAEDEDDNEEGKNQEENVENSGSRKSSKPSDYQALFGGTCDDAFMIGIKFTKKSIKLYNDFYSSDVIVASPLQLHAKIEEAEVDKEKDVDYLSSIEVLVVDHADVITMQNWSFLNSVLEQLNRIPSKQHGTDIMRIRKWYLDGFARFYRQSIILGYYVNPDINASFSRLCSNFQGKVKLSCEPKGVLPKVLLQVRQIYERFDASLVTDVDDARLDYFVNKVFPKIRDSVQGGIMLFTSSYFEFVRLRNFLKSQNASFCMIGDYTEQSDISRARVWFFEGKRKIMLYTERAHFYHRYKIRGIQNLIIYSLPERKEFYPEIVNMLDGSNDMTCTVLFSQFDQLRLERIVGAAPARKMLSSEKSVFAFC